jgi:hypothetical protein
MKFETAEQMHSGDHLIANIGISDAPETNCSNSYLQPSCDNFHAAGPLWLQKCYQGNCHEESNKQMV